MRTILVTGGAGFIGSAFLRYMTQRYPSDSFLCADNLSYAANYAAIEPLVRAGRVQFFKADICSTEQMEPIYRMRRPQITVHFAAQSHVDRSIKDPAIFLRTNVLGTGVLLDLCRTYGSERFHYVSTDEVYGPAPRAARFSEAAPLPRRRGIFWCFPMRAHTALASQSAAARIITGRINIPKS